MVSNIKAKESTMEEAETSKTKASDSAYSNSSTSQYQRSNGSSKSRHSNSSGSSGYCGQPSVLGSGNDDGFSQPQTCTMRKEKKRKQHKQVAMESSSDFWDGKESAVVVATAASAAAAALAADGRPLGGAGVMVLGAAGAGAEAPPAEAETPPPEAPSTATGPQEDSSAAEPVVVDVGDGDALQMAALTQTLHCIKRMKGKEGTLKCLQGENGVARSVNGGALDSKVKEHLDSYFNGDIFSPHDEREGFVVVVSMEDGTVVHSTPNLTASLGFPCDMWLGRDFIDFVHPKDRMSFASHITSGVARGEDSLLKGLPAKTSFYCSLRQYRGLRNIGYGVTKKRVPYLPFRLTFTFREMNIPLETECTALSPECSSRAPNTVLQTPASPPTPIDGQEKLTSDAPARVKEAEELNRSIFIVIKASRIYSAYKVPNEEITPLLPSPRKSPPLQSPVAIQSLLQTPHLPEMGIPMGKFVTRHLVSCYLSHVDPLAVPYLGYLPQDMEGRSIMDFYHPEDMPILKEAYMNVMSQPSSPFKGKPYRLRTQNGCYILVETEWSSFVNPWSRKLEFVIGQHHVLKGPSNPHVFAEPNEEDCHQFPDKVVKEGEAIQKEIMFMLDQVCSGNKKVTRVSESARQQVSKRCRDLASFMETLMDEMAKPADPLRVELPAQDEHCFSERDSVMLGEISPHHDYYDGKSSTETPPSYNQLNYNETLQRFFESKPKTTLSDESADMKMEGSVGNNQSPLSTDEEGKSFPNAMDSSSASGGERKYSSQANESESGGSGSRPRGEAVVGRRVAGGRDRGGGGQEGTGVSCREDHKPGGRGGGGGGRGEVGGGKASKAVSNNTKFKGSRGSALDGEVGAKGCVTALSGQEKGRRASGHHQVEHHSPNPEGVYRGPHLTEALLSRHNEDMEKIMVQKHREQRSLDREGKLKDGRRSSHEKVQDHVNAMHGVKRSGSHSFEGDHQRVKHQHVEQPQQHGNVIVGGNHKWTEHPLPMSATAPPPSTGNTLLPVPLAPVQTTALPNVSTTASAMASTSVAQSTKGNIRMSVVDHPLTPMPQLNMWPPISVMLTPVNNGSQPRLTYSYPGMIMPQKQHPNPNLKSSAPPAIVPHGSLAVPELLNQPRHHQQPSALMTVSHQPLPPGQQLPPTLIPASTAAGANLNPQGPPRPPGPGPYPLVSLQPFPSHMINPHQHQGGMLYYVPTGSAGMVPMHGNADNTGAQPQIVGFSPQQVPLQHIPGYPYLMPMPQSQAVELSSMVRSPCIPNHSQYPNGGPPMVYQPVGPTQVNGPASSQQVFVPSLNAYVPPSCHTPSYHPSSAHASNPPQTMASEVPILQRAPLSSAPSAQFLQRARRSGVRSNHHNLMHRLCLPEQMPMPGATAGVKGFPHQESLHRNGDGLGVFLVADREALSSAAVLGGISGKALGSEKDEEKDKGGSPLIFSKYQRPSSQATSVKAEPGSAVGSIASASRLRELLEVSKKCKSIGSSGLSKGNGIGEEDEEDEDGYYCYGDERKMSTSGNAGNNPRNGDLTRSFNLLQDPETICDDSSYSSLYSFLRTEKSDESMRSSAWDGRGDTVSYNDAKGKKKSWGSDAKMRGPMGEKSGLKPLRKGPSWLEEVDVTPDLILRYKMDDQILRNVLEADLKALKTISQSNTVNEQLSQLYMDMELEGASTKLSLEDSAGFTSSSGTDEAPVSLNGIHMSSSPSRVNKSKKKRRSMDYGKLVMIFEENAPFPPPSFST